MEASPQPPKVEGQEKKANAMELGYPKNARERGVVLAQEFVAFGLRIFSQLFFNCKRMKVKT